MLSFDPDLLLAWAPALWSIRAVGTGGPFCNLTLPTLWRTINSLYNPQGPAGSGGRGERRDGIHSEVFPVILLGNRKPANPEHDTETETVEINTEDDQSQKIEIAPPVAAPEPEEEEEETVFMVVEEMPAFPGGDAELFKFLSKNIRYPAIAQESGIQGRVICQFTVNRDGSIVDVRAVRSSGDASLDKEAIRVIQSMPKWKPGKQRGKAVRVNYTVPVTFRLQ